MRLNLAAVLQAAGLAGLTAAAFLVSMVAGLAVLGVSLLIVGIAVELR